MRDHLVGGWSEGGGWVDKLLSSNSGDDDSGDVIEEGFEGGWWVGAVKVITRLEVGSKCIIHSSAAGVPCSAARARAVQFSFSGHRVPVASSADYIID